MTADGTKSRATIREVAAAAGVSMGTVSRVAAGNPRISAATTARVLAAMEKLAYRPNAAARSMRTSVSKTVGLLIPDINCPVFHRMIAGAEEVLTRAGYLLFTFSADLQPERELAFLAAARERQMDGLIVSLADERASATVAALRATGVPLVVVDRDVSIDADFVNIDHTGAMDAVMEHLIAFGHTRIGIIGASRNRPGRERLRVYRAAMARNGIDVDEDLVRVEGGAQGSSYGAAEAHDLLTAAEPPTALIASGSDFFYGAMRAIRALNLDIPGQLSVVGADDASFGEIAGPPITVIERDMREAGREAARLLLERFSGVSLPPRRVLLPSDVVLRRSIGLAPMRQRERPRRQRATASS